MACRSGDAECRAGGGHLVLLRSGDAVILAGFLAREELLGFAGGALIHHVKIAIEIGAELEAHAVALLHHQAGIDGAPGIAVQPLQPELHAVGALGHGPALGQSQHRGEAEEGRQADH